MSSRARRKVWAYSAAFTRGFREYEMIVTVRWSILSFVHRSLVKISALHSLCAQEVARSAIAEVLFGGGCQPRVRRKHEQCRGMFLTNRACRFRPQ